MYLIKDWYVEYVKNFHNEITFKINLKIFLNRQMIEHLTQEKIFKLPINT